VPDVVVSHSITGPFPVFYMPYPGLFTDIVGRNAYNGANEKFSSQYARKMVEAAASSLAAYSPELYAGFCEAIGVVALTGEPDVQDRSSFSARMYFAGGIFSSLLRDNVPALIENLIHEYFHQRLWVWWSIEGPQDLPPETVTIVSPVTKTQKSVRVMLHAVLIYIGVSAYYRFALEHEVMSVQAREWVERRHARLSAGCADLRELLLESLGAYPESRRLAQFMADLIPPRCC